MPEVESKGLGKVIYSIDLWDLYFAACMQGLLARDTLKLSSCAECAADLATIMLKKSQERRECLSQSTQKQAD